jgi:hypothetical protein
MLLGLGGNDNVPNEVQHSYKSNVEKQLEHSILDIKI